MHPPKVDGYTVGPPPLVWVIHVHPTPPALRPVDLGGDDQGATGVFLFRPNQKQADGEEGAAVHCVQWVAGEKGKVDIKISNPCNVGMQLQRLSLLAEYSGPSDTLNPYKSNPVMVWLPANTKPHNITLSITPKYPGKVRRGSGLGLREGGDNLSNLCSCVAAAKTVYAVGW